MEEINKHINSLTKEDLVRVLGTLKNAEIGKDMLIGLGFSEKEAREIENIMETCEILCIDRYGWPPSLPLPLLPPPLLSPSRLLAESTVTVASL